MESARQVHEEAILLHEAHARHARAHGDETTARRADERAERARERLRLMPPEESSEQGGPRSRRVVEE